MDEEIVEASATYLSLNSDGTLSLHADATVRTPDGGTRRVRDLELTRQWVPVAFRSLDDLVRYVSSDT